MTEMSPQKAAAKRILEAQFERLGSRWHNAGSEQLDILRERQEAEELWRLAGLGEPPEFAPTRREAMTA